MKLLVCISSIPDTTTRIKLAGNRVDLAGVQWIINPWDELALTRALELKEGSGGLIDAVNVVSVGNKDVEPTLRKALAVGADRAWRVDAEARDSFQTASELAAVIRANPHDLILCGIDSADYNGLCTGSMLAELLDLPSVSSVSSIELREGAFVLRREIDGGYESVSAPLPLVAIVQKGIALEPRVPSMRGVMSARTKPLEVAPSASAAAKADFGAMSLPAAKGACRKIDAANAKELVELLRTEARVLQG